MNRLWLHRIKPSLFCFLIFTSGASLADEPIYSLAESPPADESKPIPISINSPVANSLKVGQEIAVPLSDGRVLEGKVTNDLEGPGLIGAGNASVQKTWVVSLPEQAGALEIGMKEGAVSQLLLFDSKEVTYHQAEIDSNGQGTLILQDTNTYQCVDFPEASNSTTSTPLAADDSGTSIAAIIPDLNTLKTLQSRPGSEKVIFIDYWGGTLSGTGWNDYFNSGNDIVYTPYSYDGDTTTFSNADRERIWLGWREAAEDYAEFDVNVTTDINVFNAAPSDKKVQNIATTTNYFFPGAGGVAFTPSFGSTGYTQASWSWNSSKGSLGMTISHEVGHQMGLAHDGTSSSGYYGGHGNWGPIMGAPFNQKYVQFSKGEYQDANNQEDDLAIVNSKLGAAADEAGETTGSAQTLTLPANDLSGVISPAGLAADTDVYQFTLISPQQVDLSVAPLIPATDDTENLGTNLSMKAALLNAAGTPVEQSSPTGLPTADDLAYNDLLDAGTYYIQVEALSNNPNWSAGFGEYGNGGFYNIAISGESSCGGSFELTSNQWRQISLPCNPGSSNTVNDVFPNMPGTYGTDWAVWRYDTDNNNNSYVDLTLSGPLEQGVGYWIIQNSANPVTLAMPSGSTPTAAASFDIPLATISNDNQWNMIGYPYDTAETLGNTTVAADSGVCVPSCDLDTAESGGIVHNQLWSYIGSGYALINTSDNLEPWMGYWTPTLVNAATVAPVKLVVPKP